MRSQWLLASLLLSALFVAAQNPPAATPAAQPGPTAAPAQKETTPSTAAPKPVALDAPVIIIKGCPEPTPGKPSTCKRQVTRAEFEKLVKALNPEMPPSIRQNFAQNYGKLLVIANEARRRGIQNSPEIQVLMDFARLQVLAQELGKRIQKQATEVPPGAIETYYREHQQEFDSAELQRIIIPKPVASKEKPVDESVEKQYVDKIRERWVAGEDPAKLQAEAYEHAGNKVQPPAVDLGARRRGAVQAELPVFDLKAGEISQLIPNPSGYFIYKVVKKENLPLAQVREDIKKLLAGQRLQEEMNKVSGSAEATLNESYFGSLAASSPAGRAPLTPAAGATVAPNPKPAQAPSSEKPETPKAVKSEIPK